MARKKIAVISRDGADNMIRGDGPNPQYMVWRVHTAALIREIIQCCTGASALSTPLSIFASILAQVADRAAELNDPKLNALMCRLTMYEQADPYSKDYIPNIVESTIDKAIAQGERKITTKKRKDVDKCTAHR